MLLLDTGRWSGRNQVFKSYFWFVFLVLTFIFPRWFTFPQCNYIFTLSFLSLWSRQIGSYQKQFFQLLSIQYQRLVRSSWESYGCLIRPISCVILRGTASPAVCFTFGQLEVISNPITDSTGREDQCVPWREINRSGQATIPEMARNTMSWQASLQLGVSIHRVYEGWDFPR